MKTKSKQPKCCAFGSLVIYILISSFSLTKKKCDFSEPVLVAFLNYHKVKKC